MRIITALYILFFSSNALVMSISTALLGVNWTDYTPTQKVVAVCMIYGGWSNTMLALIVTLAKRESQGKPLIPTDDTQIITKQQTNENQKPTSSQFTPAGS